MKKCLSILTICALLLAVFAGCGTGSEPGSGAGATGDSGGSGGSSGGARDSIVIAVVNEPTQLDPQYSGDTYGSLIILNTHDPLVRRDVNGEYQPCIAESWSYSDDNMIITFNIRQGVRFQDGSDLTAEDVVFTLNRAINTPQSSIYTESFKEARLVDEYTVELEMLYPDIAALALLAGGNNCIVSKKIVEEVGDTEYTNNICGTGPYKLVNWQKGAKITLVANEDYWMGAPAIQNVEFRILKEQTTMMVALENGEIDVAINIGALDAANVQNNTDLGYQEVGSTTTWYIGFNCQTEPLDDPLVRRALAMAINREEVIMGAVDGAGVEAVSVLPPPTVGGPSREDSPHIAYDPEGAKELLAQAGYPDGNGLKLTLNVREDLTKKIGNVVQSNWAAIGVDCDVVVMERSALLADMHEGKLQCYTVGDVALSMDASMQTSCLDSSQIPHTNSVFYVNEEYDRINLEQSTQFDDPQRRVELVTRLMEIEVEDAPRALLFHPTNNIAYNKDLNIEVSPTIEGYIVYNMSWN